MSDYLKHLPESAREGPLGGAGSFLSGYLKITEALLGGRVDAVISGKRLEGLEEHVARFEEYLDPARVPVDDPAAPILSSEFLTYLARWVGLVFDENWDLEKKRRWLERIVPLYKRRGTISGMTEYLRMFVGDRARIEEPAGGFILARRANSTVAVNTYIAGAPAYFFRVLINYAFGTEPFDITVWRNVTRGTRAIVDLEKPAHTYYKLDARTPGMILGKFVGTVKKGRSTVAKDTLLWSRSRPI